MYYILYILYVLYIIHINLYYMLYVLGYYPSTYEDTIQVHSILVHIKPLTFDWRQTFSNGSIPAHIKPLQKGLLSTYDWMLQRPIVDIWLLKMVERYTHNDTLTIFSVKKMVCLQWKRGAGTPPEADIFHAASRERAP